MPSALAPEVMRCTAASCCAPYGSQAEADARSTTKAITASTATAR